jgi:riboflavin biosynthesis pyrimidine reductase
MPDVLRRVYGGLGFADEVVYSNFVESLDGVTTLGSRPSAGSAISGRNQADRFLMGLLRAFADAVLIGAGTLRATPGHHWTPDHIFPDATEAFADLRMQLGRKPRPRLVVITGSGEIPISHPAIVGGATIATGETGARALEGRLPDSCDVMQLIHDDPMDMTSVIDGLANAGYRVLLTEGGPHLIGELIRQERLDEAFITISPVIAGRGEEPRLGMVAGVEFLPGRGVWTTLLSARRHDDFLFLRYGLKTG